MPDPRTGQRLSQHDLLRSVRPRPGSWSGSATTLVRSASGMARRIYAHPPVPLLTAVAGLTSRIRLLTGVTVLSIDDPVLVAEQYALLDDLSEGRLDLVIAKGNHGPRFDLVGLDREKQRDVLAEKVRAAPPALVRGERHLVGPVPRRDHRGHHAAAAVPGAHQGLARERDKPGLDRAGRPVRRSAVLGRRFLPHAGLPGADRPLPRAVGALWPRREPCGGGRFPALLIRGNSQDAIEAYRPFWNAQRETPAARHNNSPFWELEEFIEQGSALIGSPEQVLDKSTGSPRASAGSSPGSASTRCHGSGSTSTSNGSPPASSLSCAAATPARSGTYGPVRALRPAWCCEVLPGDGHPAGYPAQIHCTAGDPFRSQERLDARQRHPRRRRTVEIFDNPGPATCSPAPSLPPAYDEQIASLRGERALAFCRSRQQHPSRKASPVAAIRGTG